MVVSGIGRIRRLGESEISPDPTVQAEYEQIVIRHMVSYRTVFHVACMFSDIAVVKHICELSDRGYDPVMVADVIWKINECNVVASNIQTLFDKLADELR